MQCPKCGHDNRPDASACSSCYYDLSSTTAPVIPPPVNDATRVQSPAPVAQPTAAQPVNGQQTVMGAPPTYQPTPAPGAPGAFPGPGSPIAAPQYMEYMGFWPRVAGALIDFVVLTACSLLLMIVTGSFSSYMQFMQAAPTASPEQMQIMSQALTAKMLPVNVLGYIISIGYYIGLIAARGATLGKMALGMKIVKEDGSPIGLGTTIGRCLLEYIFAAVTCGGLSYLAVAFSPTCQGWHDKIMGTVVVRSR